MGAGMNDYKELIYKIRGAAARWEEEHPIVGVGQMRYCDALRDAANAIEQLCADVTRLEAETRAKEQYIAETIGKVIKERDEWKTLGSLANKRAEDYREMRRQRDEAIKERDAAIADLLKIVNDPYNVYGNNKYCYACKKRIGKKVNDKCKRCEFEWRGVREVEHE